MCAVLPRHLGKGRSPGSGFTRRALSTTRSDPGHPRCIPRQSPDPGIEPDHATAAFRRCTTTIELARPLETWPGDFRVPDPRPLFRQRLRGIACPFHRHQDLEICLSTWTEPCTGVSPPEHDQRETSVLPCGTPSTSVPALNNGQGPSLHAEK